MPKDGHATGMAGEFFVMQQLFRLGHLPALTLGNAKTIDIFVKTKVGDYEVSVKTVQGGGKWGVGKANYSQSDKLIFVFLLYKDFKDLETTPEVYVMPAQDVEKYKHPWLGGTSAVFYSHKQLRANLDPYKNAWKKYLPDRADDI